jgi:transposase
MHLVPVRYDVQRARRAGLPAAWISQHYGVSVRTQQRILQERIRFGMSDKKPPSHHAVPPPPALTPEHCRLLAGWLAAEPRLPRVQLLRRLTTEHGYTGGKSAFYDYLRRLPPTRPAPLPVVRFEGVPGEFAQHDFGSLTLTYTDGKREKLTFYAARLKYSRALHVCLVPGETAEAFLRGLEGFAAAVGGLPQRNVMDNTKAAVIRRDRDPQTRQVRVQLQQDLQAFLAEVGVFAEPTAPYAGNQKGSVENLIRFIKENFLQPRQFRDRADVEAQLAGWLHWVNRERKCDATGEVPWVRLAEEAVYLKPVPAAAEGYGLLRTAVVGREGWVRSQGCGYSAPHLWIGQVVEVRRHRETVVLTYQGERVVHPRTPENGRYSLLPEHRKAYFVKPRGAVMFQRQLLMDLAPVVQRFFTELVHRRPDSWREKDLPGLWAAYERVGGGAFVRAVEGCMAAGTYGGEYVTERLVREAGPSERGDPPERGDPAAARTAVVAGSGSGREG